MSSSDQNDYSQFIWLFQFCSFLSPISKTRFLLQNISLILWSLTHIGFAILELTLIYMHLSDTFHNGSVIGRILDIVQVVVPILAHIIFICETLFNWNVQLEMWEIIKSVEFKFELIRVQKLSFMKSFVIEISTLAFVGMVSESYILASMINDIDFARSWYLRLWSLFMIRFGMMQLIFYVDWMRCHVNMIIKGLLCAKTDKSNEKLLSELKLLYSNIWLLSVLFNKRFAWSILAIMIHLFITIVICFYWVVARLYFHLLSAEYLGASLFMCISPVTNLLVLLYSCRQCIEQASQVGHSIHLMNLNVIPSTQILIHNFSLQVKILKISIYGWGLFVMNFAFLVDMFSACAAYILLIYSIQ